MDGHTNEVNEIMRIDKAAAFLGISEGTLYHWVSESRVPVIRISKRCIRFRRSDLEKWLDNMTASPGNGTQRAR